MNVTCLKESVVHYVISEAVLREIYLEQFDREIATANERNHECLFVFPMVISYANGQAKYLYLLDSICM